VISIDETDGHKSIVYYTDLDVSNEKGPPFGDLHQAVEGLGWLNLREHAVQDSNHTVQDGIGIRNRGYE